MANESPRAVSGITAEPIQLTGAGGDRIDGYAARPLGDGPFPGVVISHHGFGLDQPTRDMMHKFASAGYIAVAPNLYARFPPFEQGDMARVMEAVRGVGDAQAVGDLEAANSYIRAMPSHNGKVGAIGHCSGGRHTLLLACSSDRIDAAVDCYGGGVVTDEVSDGRPRPVIDLVPDLVCPLLGLFGEADRNPAPEHVAAIEAALKANGKQYDFTTYPAPAAHGFFSDERPAFVQSAAADGWQRIFEFFGTHLK